MYTKFQNFPTIWKKSKSTKQAMKVSNATTWSTDVVVYKQGMYDVGAIGLKITIDVVKMIFPCRIFFN